MSNNQFAEGPETFVVPANGPTYLGTTPPVSYTASTTAELANNSELIYYLKGRSIFETESGQLARKCAISTLNDIIVKWAVSVGMKKNISPEFLLNGGGIQLRIYGSQRLDVHSPTADIGLNSFHLYI